MLNDTNVFIGKNMLDYRRNWPPGGTFFYRSVAGKKIRVAGVGNRFASAVGAAGETFAPFGIVA